MDGGDDYFVRLYHSVYKITESTQLKQINSMNSTKKRNANFSIVRYFDLKKRKFEKPNISHLL